jgi:hypothetical protein
MRVAGRSSERRYREFAIPRWSLAFRSAIQNATGSKLFTHVLAVTLAKGDPTLWEQYGPFREAMAGNPLKVVTLSDMVLAIEERLTTTPAATDIGRTLQLFKAAGLRPRPSPPVQTTDVPDDEKWWGKLMALSPSELNKLLKVCKKLPDGPDYREDNYMRNLMLTALDFQLDAQKVVMPAIGHFEDKYVFSELRS